MANDKKSIDKLISEARLEDAQNLFNEFLVLCEDCKDDLMQNQERLARFKQQELAGLLSREDGIERNKITLAFITDISTFKSKLSNYFGVGDNSKVFDEIKSRNEIIKMGITSRVQSKQYTVGEQLKDGNSSLIYKLYNVNTEQEAVAMILKSPELSIEAKVEFIQLTKLKHRNIIKLLDHVLDSFPFFIITEFINGENLVNVLEKTGTRPMAQLIDWLYDLADALDYMRHKGVLHTNVRPSKIFIDEESKAMISPFYINQLNKAERTFSLYRDICTYGSPELVLCDGDPLTLEEMCVSDQYSLGLIAYKILTGNDLFTGNTIVDILKDRYNFATNKKYRAKKLSIFPKNVVGDIIKKLMNEDPAKRFTNLHEVVKALHAHNRSTKASRPSNSVRDSYRRCLAKNRMLIVDFYRALFKKLPLVEADFKTPQRQIGMLQMSIDLLIDIDEKKGLLVSLMTNEKHKSYTLNHFDIFIETLLEIIKKNDPKWVDIQSEWQILKEKTINIIKEARHLDTDIKKC